MRTVTLEVPDNVTDEQARRAVERASDDWLTMYWHIDDVIALSDEDNPISNDRARVILKMVEVDCAYDGVREELKELVNYHS